MSGIYTRNKGLLDNWVTQLKKWSGTS